MVAKSRTNVDVVLMYGNAHIHGPSLNSAPPTDRFSTTQEIACCGQTDLRDVVHRPKLLRSHQPTQRNTCSLRASVAQTKASNLPTQKRSGRNDHLRLQFMAVSDQCAQNGCRSQMDLPRMLREVPEKVAGLLHSEARSHRLGFPSKPKIETGSRNQA